MPSKPKISKRFGKVLRRARDAILPTSHPSSPHAPALARTSTANIPNDAPGVERNRSQDAILSPPHPSSQRSSNLLGTNPTEKVRKTPGVVGNRSQDTILPTSRTSSQQSSSHLAPNTSDKLKNAWGVAWKGLETALRLLEKGAAACPPLQSTVGGLVACLNLTQAVAGNREEYEKLAMELTSMANTLVPYVTNLVAEDVNGSVARIMESIKAELTHIGQQQDRGKITRIVEANQDQGDVIQRYRRIKSLFRQLQSDVSLRTWQDTRKLRETALLKDMSPVDDARYNSSYSTTIKRRGCTAETREKILEDLKGWVVDPKGAKVYWMNGMAGTGKTTIGYSLCEWLEENRRLGGNYFCSRISPLCRDVSNVVPTLAYQLAQYSSAFRSALYKVLEGKPEASKLNVKGQFEKLVQEPMQAVKTAMPEGVVVVIDALDECDDSYAFRLFLETLLKLAADLPIKFFVTSRPEPAIREKMLAPGYSPSILHLHDVEESIVEADIKKYLTEALGSMSPSPSPNEVERLAKLAGKLFIYAATAVRYIHPGDLGVNSSARLRTVLGMVSGSTKQHDELNGLYTTILSAAVDPKRLEEQEVNDILLTLWTVVCAKEPMTVQTLASLLRLTEEQVRFALQPLRSILHVQEGVQGLVSPFHASFPDYLFDKRRSGEFHCETTRHSEILADGCFDLMKAQLKFNICKLESSFVFDEDVLELQERIEKSISAALSYACRYWGEHLRQGNFPVTVHERLVEFLTHRLLFWMEVLNLERRMAIGGEILRQVQHWLPKESHIDTRKQVADAEAFVTRFAAGACTRSTPHIYISGLPFCPRSSSVRENYWGHTRGLIDVRGSAVEQWPSAAIGIWKTDSKVMSVAFSPDGTRIVSGGGDDDEGTIRVWDARTGDTVAGSFKGHTDWVRSVAFSLEGTRIVSGSDDETIRVWDACTGNTVAGPFKGHTNAVWSVAFSPDGTRIVSGSDDETIRVWDARTGDTVAGPFKGHTSLVRSVTFSPDGTRIASGSYDQTIRVWDACTGGTVAGPFKGHTDWVSSVAFSPDGICIVSGSYDETIRVWDARTGDTVAGPFKGHTNTVWSVAFSLDGTRIVSGSDDQTIRVWDARTGDTVAGPFEGHTLGVESVTFSPDSTRIVSGSYDQTIRVWDARTGNTIAGPFKGHTNSVWSVAFSPDGTRIVSGSSDKTIQVWDAHTGNTIAGPFKGHTSLVRSVAFSPDGMRIVSGSYDETIRVWDARTGGTVTGPFKGHAGSVNSVAFSPDGARIVSGSDDQTIRVWDARTGDTVAGPFKGHTNSVWSVAFSPNGTHIVSGSDDKTIRVWDARTGNTITGPFKGHTGSVRSVAFSPDGTRIVSGSYHETVRVWDARTGDTAAGPFKGHAGCVNSVAFSPDGTRIVSGSFDETIRVWDSHTGNTIAGPFEGHTDSVTSVAFSPDGTCIVSGSYDQTIRIWDVHSDILSMENFTFEQDGWITAHNVLFFWISPTFVPSCPILVTHLLSVLKARLSLTIAAIFPLARHGLSVISPN
ncbi:hypothetical protein BDZ97DRAFT_740307 [Flammula alnicola]|nr:hypothetical protein BDZ97DRAFT_740307 [Flammula alnicola]